MHAAYNPCPSPSHPASPVLSSPSSSPLPPMVPTLPVEVCERVIDALQDDPAALRACARTARDWLPRSRFHLFRALHVSSARELAALARLHAHRPALAALVRALTLVHSYSNDALCHAPVPRLPPVSALSLASCPCSPPLARPPLPLLAALPHVHTLTLDNIRFPRLAHLTAILSALPRLAVLRCSRLRTLADDDDDDDDDDAQPAAPCLLLEECTLDAALLAPLARWLVPHSAPARLARLHLPLAPAAAPLVRAAGPALHHLALAPGPAHPELHAPAAHPALASALADAPALRTLRVAAPCTPAAALALLAPLAAPALQRITLALAPLALAPAQQRAWARLDALLATPRFRALDALVLQGAAAPPDALHACLPRAHARALLRVEAAPPVS